MSHFLFGYGFVLATSLIVVLGDVTLKSAADAEATFTSHRVLIGASLYAFSALLWYFTMRHISLGQAAVAFSMLTLIALAVIGAVWFKETLGPREWAGLGCAMLAMILMTNSA